MIYSVHVYYISLFKVHDYVQDERMCLQFATSVMIKPG